MLNQYQQAIIDSLAKGPQVIEACPGSGKTRTLEFLIAALIESGANPLRIGAFTFSNKSASEMRWRVARKLFPEATQNELDYFAEPFKAELDDSPADTRVWIEADPRRVFIVDWICTIHALSYRLLKAAGYKLRVLSGKEQYEVDNIIKDGLKELDWEESPKAIKHWISKAIFDLVEPRQSETYYAQALADCGGPVWRAGTLAELYRRYRDFLKFRKLVDFDLMQANVVYLLRNDPAFRAKATSMFDYILVDEAQDTSYQQCEIAWTLGEATNNIVFIGDTDQSLYAFRGAEPRVIRDYFVERYPAVQRFNLPINYRSAQSIITTAAKLITRNYAGSDDMYLKPFNWRETAEIGVPMTYTETSTFAELSENIANAILQSEAPGDWFVLSRTRAECAMIHTTLLSMGIPAINKSGGILFGAPHIRKVLAYARLACNYRDARDNVEILSEIANVATANFRAPMTRRRHVEGCCAKPWQHCGCPIIQEEGMDYSAARFYGHKSVEAAGNWQGIVEQQFERNKGGFITIVAKGAQDLVSFVERLERLGNDATRVINTIITDCVMPWLATEEGLDDADLAENGKSEDFAVLTGLAINKTLLEFLQTVDELGCSDGDSGAKERESVKVGTFHWSKGTENKYVAINTTRLPIVSPKLRQDQLPVGKPATIEEERRLLFVGITRAKEECHLFGARQWNNYEIETSLFIHELELEGNNAN